jgi:Lrp/AsnC family leucine-responsive transcriptional regulator
MVDARQGSTVGSLSQPRGHTRAPAADAPPWRTIAAMDEADSPRGARTIDKIDRRILRVLQADGRISNLKLAEAVHLSPTAVLERVRRLQRDGYILGYEARLDPALLGAGLLVFIEVLLDRTVHDVMDTFKAAVQARPEILEAHLVAGGFDYLLKTRVADMGAYRQFIGNVIWTLPGVRETRTYAVMEEVKHTTQLPL